MNNNDEIKKYVIDRHNAIKSMDVETFKRFVDKYKPPCLALPGDDVIEIAMRKMAVNDPSQEIDLRVESFRWLLERGHDAEIAEVIHD